MADAADTFCPNHLLGQKSSIHIVKDIRAMNTDTERYSPVFCSDHGNGCGWIGKMDVDMVQIIFLHPFNKNTRLGKIGQSFEDVSRTLP